MAGLAAEKLAPYADRAEVAVTDGSPPHAEPTGGYDRFVTNFVLDLLSAADISEVVAQAERMLRPGGLLCVSSLGQGHTAISRGVGRIWTGLHQLSPALVGGCRPIDVRAFLGADAWTVRHRGASAPFGLPLEVVVAARN